MRVVVSPSVDVVERGEEGGKEHVQRDGRCSVTITTPPDLPPQLSADGPEDNSHQEPKGGARNRGEEEHRSGEDERDVSQAEEHGPDGAEHEEVEARFEVVRGVASSAARVAIAIERAARGMLSMARLRRRVESGQRTG